MPRSAMTLTILSEVAKKSHQLNLHVIHVISHMYYTFRPILLLYDAETLRTRVIGCREFPCDIKISIRDRLQAI